MKRKIHYRWLVWVMALLFAGCATVAPQTPSQRLAVIDAQVTALYNTAADLREGGVVTDEQAAELQTVFSQIDTALDAGWAAAGVGDLTKAENQIRLLNELLWRLRAQLEEVQ